MLYLILVILSMSELVSSYLSYVLFTTKCMFKYKVLSEQINLFIYTQIQLIYLFVLSISFKYLSILIIICV